MISRSPSPCPAFTMNLSLKTLWRVFSSPALVFFLVPFFAPSANAVPLEPLETPQAPLEPRCSTPQAPLEPLNTLYRILDSMVKVMEGERSQVPLQQFLKIRNSIYRLDTGLATSQEKGWIGLLEYYRDGGGEGDAWGTKPSSFEERNVTFFPVGRAGLLVFEPCNYASNIAYYQMVVGLASPRHRWTLKEEEVKALGQASAALALGSAFWHGSHTRLGQAADGKLISVMSLIMHQASLSGLPSSVLSPELTDLSTVRRPKTGVQIAQVVTDMYALQPVGQWRSTLASLDLPRYEVTFSAIITTLITLLLPTSIAEPLIRTLINIFGISNLGPFILDTYLPRIRRALFRTRLPFLSKLQLLKNTLSTVYKLVFAFLFQEQTIDIDLVTSPLGNQIGAFLQPKSNTVASFPSSLPNLSPSLTLGSRLYPGSSWCSASQPHSLWHAQSAAGLLDFFLLIDNLVATIY